MTAGFPQNDKAPEHHVEPDIYLYQSMRANTKVRNMCTFDPSTHGGSMSQ